jgi:hypothetical protein
LSQNFCFSLLSITAAPANMTDPTLQSLGDLTKEVGQMIVILCAVQFQGAVKTKSLSPCPKQLGFFSSRYSNGILI